MNRITLTARYCCTGEAAAAIVAVVTYNEAQLLDWAAYFGASRETWHEEDCVSEVAEHGDKISREDAHYFFPDLPIKLYRL